MIGPCMCGDPCCPRCGSPAQCQQEEALQMFYDRVCELNLTEAELLMFEQVGTAAIKAYREAVKIDISNQAERE